MKVYLTNLAGETAPAMKCNEVVITEEWIGLTAKIDGTEYGDMEFVKVEVEDDEQGD